MADASTKPSQGRSLLGASARLGMGHPRPSRVMSLDARPAHVRPRLTCGADGSRLGGG
jgi:hypothetical protein